MWETPPEVQQLRSTTQQQGPPAPSFTVKSVDGSSNDLSQYVSDSSLAPTNAQEYSSDSDRMQAFKDLLKENGVDETWTFSRAMKSFIREPRYWAISESLERKKVFDEYLAESKHQREEQKRQEKRENMEKMLAALEKYPEILYYTKWRTVKEKLDQDPIFQTSDVKERRSAFVKYVQELRAQHYKELDANRIHAMQLLEERLRELEVKTSSRWLDTYSTIKSELQDDKFKMLDKVDVLTAYSAYMKDIEREANEERQKLKKAQRRKERKIRQEFTALLEDLRKEGKIQAGTKWSSIFPLIKEDQRFLEMCGQPGSTPLELFWDITEEEERKLKLQREMVLDVVTSRRFDVSHDTSFETFKDAIGSDSRLVDVTPENLVTIFEYLKRNSVKRKEHDRYADERKTRRNQDAFRAVLKELEPPVLIDDKWEDVKGRVSETEEFKALSESARLDAFDRHIRRLKDRLRDREYDRESERERDRERERRNRERSERWDWDRPRSTSRDRRRRDSRSSNSGPVPPYHSRPPPAKYYPAPPYYEDPQRPYLEY